VRELEHPKSYLPPGPERADAVWAANHIAAFTRGAEAMRERAMGAAWHACAMGLHKRIKEMPIPGVQAMTENEKLRALLEEARETLHLCVATDSCQHPECRLYRFFAASIDAALAEPVKDDFKRGAEAMREAAVQTMQVFCEQAMSTGNVDWANRYLGIGDELSRLTVPEDK